MPLVRKNTSYEAYGIKLPYLPIPEFRGRKPYTALPGEVFFSQLRGTLRSPRLLVWPAASIASASSGRGEVSVPNKNRTLAR